MDKHFHFKKTVRALGTTKQAGLALGVTDRTVANWLKGQFPLAVDILFNRPELALAVLLDSILQNPQDPLAKELSPDALYTRFNTQIENTTLDEEPEPLHAETTGEL